MACFSPISFPQHCRPPGPGLVHSASVPHTSHRYRRPNSVAIPIPLLSLQRFLHLTAATGLIHELPPVAFELENLYAAVVLLQLSLLGRELSVGITAPGFHLLTFLAEDPQFTLQTSHLVLERMMFRKPHRCDPRRSPVTPPRTNS